MEKTKAYSKQSQDYQLKKRLAEDRRIEEQLEDVHKAKIAAEVSRWNENAELTAEFNRLKNHNLEVQKEVKLGGQTLIQIRRQQLKQLLEAEEEAHIAELNEKGLTLFKERL